MFVISITLFPLVELLPASCCSAEENTKLCQRLTARSPFLHLPRKSHSGLSGAWPGTYSCPAQFPAAFHLTESQFCLQELLAQGRDKQRADFHLGSVFSAVDGLEDPSAPGRMELLQHFPMAPSILALLLSSRRVLVQGRVEGSL